MTVASAVYVYKHHPLPVFCFSFFSASQSTPQAFDYRVYDSKTRLLPLHTNILPSKSLARSCTLPTDQAQISPLQARCLGLGTTRAEGLAGDEGASDPCRSGRICNDRTKARTVEVMNNRPSPRTKVATRYVHEDFSPSLQLLTY
jgi:hypothetical protein